jgi:hypothetical protein
MLGARRMVDPAHGASLSAAVLDAEALCAAGERVTSAIRRRVAAIDSPVAFVADRLSVVAGRGPAPEAERGGAASSTAVEAGRSLHSRLTWLTRTPNRRPSADAPVADGTKTGERISST